MKRSFAVFALSVLLLAFSKSAYCAKPGNIAAKARKEKAFLIACSPKGDVPDTISLAEGLEKLSPNKELRLSPGDYGDAMIDIKVKDILITGSDPNELCKINLMITAKCIIRNVHLEAAYIDCKVTIVDSIIDKCYLKYTDKKKTLQVIDNSCFNYLYVEPANKEVSILNSTIAHGQYGLEFGVMTKPNTSKRLKGSLLIENCVICGKRTPFYTERGARLSGLTFNMENVIYFGEWGPYMTHKVKDKVLKWRNACKELRFKLKEKKNSFTRPEFKEKDSFALSDKFSKKHKSIGAKFNKDGVLTPLKKR